MGVQILHIEEPDKPAKDCWAMVQTKKEMMGVGNILTPYHVYIGTCASWYGASQCGAKTCKE